MKTVKIILALLFSLCLFDMPYGFYQLVRFIALVGFALLANKSYEEENINLTIVYVGLALLFQPFIKISLGHLLWNVTDIVVALFLLATIRYPKIEQKIKGKK